MEIKAKAGSETLPGPDRYTGLESTGREELGALSQEAIANLEPETRNFVF